ncbi:MAG: histone deacetylase [Elusimicrobia bacterium]|nr:histone deacetylase [Elusimicrobiota bacterium]
MKIVTSNKCWQYSYPGYNETAQRIQTTFECLKVKNFEFVEPEKCSEGDILAVHTQAMVEKVKTLAFSDPDIKPIPGIYEYALLSAGAAITASEIALKGLPAFSLMRPPGHHATKSHSGGFCYFNNIAIAVKKLILSGTAPVAILDIDCHHGNGTQNIFLGKENILFVSLHQIPLYPGSGLTSEKNCLNFPLPPETGEEKYLKTLEIALKEIEKFKPAVIAVSAGFDTYIRDPLTQMNLETATYEKIGKMIAALHTKRFAVLEGGYSRDLAECVYNFLEGFRR